MKEAGITAEQLLRDSALRSFLVWVARAVGQQIVDLEWRHGRNRSRSHAHGLTRMDSFVSRAVNAEARLLHQSRWDLQRILASPMAQHADARPGSELASALPQTGDPPEPERKRVRASTAKELHRWEYQRARKLLGEKSDAIDAGARCGVSEFCLR